jgi:NAD-dependent deacetylase
VKIVAFTGAGISRESGLRTFRDSGDGLWEGYNVQDVASLKGWWKDPAQVLSFYDMRRREVLAAQPNAGHLALAALESDHEVVVVTQNVDDLHERAGSTHVIHLHGEVLKVRPIDDESRVLSWREELHIGDLDPVTGSQLRPHVVWFGEGLPKLDEALAVALAPDVDVLIVVGTSLNVYPAAMVATETSARHVFLVDPRPPALPAANLTVFAEPASTGVPRVVQRIQALD